MLACNRAYICQKKKTEKNNTVETVSGPERTNKKILKGCDNEKKMMNWRRSYSQDLQYQTTRLSLKLERNPKAAMYCYLR